MRVLLISTYDLGRQPFGLASAAAWLHEVGCDVTVRDTSRDALTPSDWHDVSLVAWFLPMHTAVRLAVPQIRRVRACRPGASLCAFGLYAPLSDRVLRAAGVHVVLGPECEQELAALARTRRLTSPAADGPALAVAGATIDPDLGAVRTLAGPTVAADRTFAAVPDISTAPDVADPSAVAGHLGTADDAPARGAGPRPRPRVPLPRWSFRVPRRQGLPPLDRYAMLRHAHGARVVGYTEASRGCKHTCRHCPVVPVYGGRFRVVPLEVVRADIAQQLDAGARHVTFGDPDFFNGIGHALAVLEMMRVEFSGTSFDVTIKVEHLRRHAKHLVTLAASGCVLVTSAVESFDDHVLERLRKGHTCADVREVVTACRGVGLSLAPTFVAFSPWTSLESYVAFLERAMSWDLVSCIAPVQLALRLLVTEDSGLLELAEVRDLVGEFDSVQLVHPWAHVDPRVDALQRHVSELVELGVGRARWDLFEDVYALATAAAGLPRGDMPRAARTTIPYLDEPWYC